MSALEQFRQKAQIPANFGAEQPYVRLASVDASGDTGADADVEFDGDAGCVRVTVTEWEKSSTGTARTPVMRAIFDARTGALMGEDDEDALPSLLVAIDGMRVLGEEDAA